MSTDPYMIPSRYGSPEPTPAQKSVPQPVQLDPNDRDIAALRQLILDNSAVAYTGQMGMCVYRTKYREIHRDKDSNTATLIVKYKRSSDNKHVTQLVIGDPGLNFVSALAHLLNKTAYAAKKWVDGERAKAASGDRDRVVVIS